MIASKNGLDPIPDKNEDPRVERLDRFVVQGFSPASAEQG
jgi:hypothetical protein